MAPMRTGKKQMAQIFPKWTNEIPKIAPPVVLIIGAIATFAGWYWGGPKHTDVGYQPKQPIAYSHKLHAGDLGMDCRYCHTYVEQGPHAGVPPTQTCMNCHAHVKTDSAKLAPLRQSWATGKAIKWLRVHKIPDYAYFDHSAHMNIAQGKAAVGCKTCHGRIDQMVTVSQVEPLSMGWCLECHRSIREESGETFAAWRIRPKNEITNMLWEPDTKWETEAEKIRTTLRPPTVECSGCHR